MLTIKQTTTAKGAFIVDGLVFVADEVIQNITDEVMRRERDAILGRVAQYPRRALHPFQFNTAKSRRWWFAAVNGKIPGVNIPTDSYGYARSTKLARAWDVRQVKTENGATIVIENTAPYAGYVYGQLNLKNALAGDYKRVRGHINTGWRGVNAMVIPEVDRLQATIQQWYTDVIEEKRKVRVTRTVKNTWGKK